MAHVLLKENDLLGKGFLIYSEEVSGELVELDLTGNGGLIDIEPLRGLKLRRLVLNSTGVADLSVTNEEVFAIGSPGLGEIVFEQSISPGRISNNRREKDGKLWLQHSVPTNPGNSGGPLLNDYGEVVGIVKSQAASLNQVGLAIPAERVRELFRRAREAKGARGGR